LYVIKEQLSAYEIVTVELWPPSDQLPFVSWLAVWSAVFRVWQVTFGHASIDYCFVGCPRVTSSSFSLLVLTGRIVERPWQIILWL